MNPAPPVTTNTSVMRGIVSSGVLASGRLRRAPAPDGRAALRCCRIRARLRRAPAPDGGAAIRGCASARERGGAESRARPAVLLARRGEDVEHDAAHAQRAAAVGHVGRGLPEIAGLHVVLDAVLHADPLALEAHAPLLVGVRVLRRDGARLERDHREHRVHAGEHARAHAGRELSLDAARLQIVEARYVAHGSLLREDFTARLVRRTVSARTATLASCVERSRLAPAWIRVASRDPNHYTMPRYRVGRHRPRRLP